MDTNDEFYKVGISVANNRLHDFYNALKSDFIEP